MSENHIYIAIDLKSFYASAECVERGLDPLTTNLVVADASRTEKTICLAVSPSLKSYGISGRARLFEVESKVKEINKIRILRTDNKKFAGSSFDSTELKENKNLKLDYIKAIPRMAYYMEYSTKIYDIYLKYVAPKDIHVYSIDEVFMDVTHYLKIYNLSPAEFAMKLIREVLSVTGITATAGIGTNMYLCKIAMDIEAKHIAPDENGVRIAFLDEMSYRRKLWNHRPLTDFWRVGRGYAKKLEKNGMFTMGDVARCSIGKENEFFNEELLYKLFGINAELLIDHAWGYEPTTIKDIKAYKPSKNSISSGQVLKCPYTCEKARLVVEEMADSLVLDLVEKRLMTNQIVITIGYDIDNLINKDIASKYKGEVTTDHYGRKVPKHAHGTINLEGYSSSTVEIVQAVLKLYDRIINEELLVRRMYVVACNVTDEKKINSSDNFVQMNLFSDYGEIQEKENNIQKNREKERKIQQAMIDMKKKYGKNAVLKGMNLLEGGTAIERNGQIGGHKA